MATVSEGLLKEVSNKLNSRSSDSLSKLLEDIKTNTTSPTGGGANTSSAVTVASVAQSTSNVQLIGSTTARKGMTIYNDGNQSVFIRLGTIAATTSLFTVKLQGNDYYEVPFGFTGAIQAIWQSAGPGSVLITEFT